MTSAGLPFVLYSVLESERVPSTNSLWAWAPSFDMGNQGCWERPVRRKRQSNRPRQRSSQFLVLMLAANVGRRE